MRCPIFVAPSCPLIDILSTFQLGRAHLALVSNAPEAALAKLMEGKEGKEGGWLEGEMAPVGIICLEVGTVGEWGGGGLLGGREVDRE